MSGLSGVWRTAGHLAQPVRSPLHVAKRCGAGRRGPSLAIPGRFLAGPDRPIPGAFAARTVSHLRGPERIASLTLGAQSSGCRLGARKRIGRGRFEVRFFIRVPKGSSHHLTKPRGALEDRFLSILSEAGNRLSAGRAIACAWTWVPRCHFLGPNHRFIFPPLPYLRTRPIYVT